MTTAKRIVPLPDKPHIYLKFWPDLPRPTWVVERRSGIFSYDLTLDLRAIKFVRDRNTSRMNNHELFN